MTGRRVAIPKNVLRINEELERRYGLNLPYVREHLIMVRDHYVGKRQHILTQKHITEAQIDNDYIKAVLISEAANLILREISPERTRKRTSRKDKK